MHISLTFSLRPKFISFLLSPQNVQYTPLHVGCNRQELEPTKVIGSLVVKYLVS